MIKLQVEDYCQDCMYFTPDIETISYEDFYGVEIADHTVKCEYAERCRHIKEYLEGNRNE